MTISMFTDVTINGKDFSEIETVREFARAWSAQADKTSDSNLFWIADSLFDLLDSIEGIA